MVCDIVATRERYERLGLKPSALGAGSIHRSFRLSGPDDYTVTVTVITHGRPTSVTISIPA